MSWRLNHPGTCVSRWLLQGNGDDAFGRWPGTPANMTGWPASGPKNGLTCGEFNGTTSDINLDDITQLNAVSAFTLCFWMNQDVIDTRDALFNKEVDGNNRVRMATWDDGNLYTYVSSAGISFGTFDYSTVMSAGAWAHIAMVFDGSQVDDASRLVVYVDGIPVTLAFTGTIPAITADLSGQDMFIGAESIPFDGRFWDWRIYNVPLSRDEVNRIIHGPVPVV